MQLLKQTLLLASIVLVALVSSCKKANPDVSGTGDVITATGQLQLQGSTTYQYGTHTLTTSGATPVKYVLRSQAIDLDLYVGMTVTITATGSTNTPEKGPELYTVTSIVP